MKQNKFVYKKKRICKKGIRTNKSVIPEKVISHTDPVRFDGNNFRFGSIYLLPVFYESF